MNRRENNRMLRYGNRPLSSHIVSTTAHPLFADLGALTQERAQLVGIFRQTACVLRTLSNKIALATRADSGERNLGTVLALLRNPRKAEIGCANLADSK